MASATWCFVFVWLASVGDWRKEICWFWSRLSGPAGGSMYARCSTVFFLIWNLISCCMCRPHTLTPVVMQCLFVIGFLSLLKERLIHIRSCKYTTQTNPILIFVTFHLWTLATWYSRRISIRAMISLRGHGPAAVWWLRTPVKKTLVV